MSRLEKIAQMVRSLPEMERERGRIRIALRVGEEATKTAQGLAVAQKQAPHIDALTGSKMVQVTGEAVTFSIGQAKTLKKLVRRESFGTEQKISEHLENLAKKLQGLENQRNQTWTKVQGEAQKVQTILNIATTLNLESIGALTTTIREFQAATASPPKTSADVEMVINARKANNMAIVHSGLSGNVQKILEGAINQAGDPKLLLEEDVKKFLNDHPVLWGSLKLRLA